MQYEKDENVELVWFMNYSRYADFCVASIVAHSLQSIIWAEHSLIFSALI